MMSPQQRSQAAEEVKALKALHHPFVVKYRESFVHNRRYLCIVMHYCKYGDLAKILKVRREQRQLLDEAQILKWFVQVALALKHIHENQIIHRDLKTENLFLDAHNNIQIGDFGIGRPSTLTASKVSNWRHCF